MYFCVITLCLFSSLPERYLSCFYHLIIKQVLHPAESHLSPKPASWHHVPEAMTAPNSQTAISHTAGWRGWCDDSDVSPAPVPFLRPPATTNISWRMNQGNQRALMWFPVLLRVKGTSRFLFPLIWLLVGAQAHERAGKSGDTGNLLQWLNSYLYQSTSKPLIRDRNRTKRSTHRFSNPDS